MVILVKLVKPSDTGKTGNMVMLTQSSPTITLLTSLSQVV
ncbi:13435_t:CDS:2 [Dentiscutata erythropus]|uniref:13435_t:CDS:1 n=1 Tax=Dentiscutata erythropus TaxID=1348616 RepID=A0A9N9C379_9GLOM|nr:13435_t:CDS:2 [Dentiscutata erythropus]